MFPNLFNFDGRVWDPPPATFCPISLRCYMALLLEKQMKMHRHVPGKARGPRRYFQRRNRIIFCYTIFAMAFGKFISSVTFGSWLFHYFFAPPARRFQVHNDTFQSIILLFFRTSGEAILGTQRYFLKDYLIFLFAPPARRF